MRINFLSSVKKRFKDKYGYDLGVPVNWSAHEDIVEFFSKYVKEIDGVTVYGHMDYGKRAPNLGGLIEFYRSPDRAQWTPTGINVPDYPKLAQLWWQQIGDVNSDAFTPRQALDRLAGEMDTVMAHMQRADEANKTYGGCGPRLNEEKDASEWLGMGGAKAKLDNEKPRGKTINYDELIERWSKG